MATTRTVTALAAALLMLAACGSSTSSCGDAYGTDRDGAVTEVTEATSQDGQPPDPGNPADSGPEATSGWPHPPKVDVLLYLSSQESLRDQAPLFSRLGLDYGLGALRDADVRLAFVSAGWRDDPEPATFGTYDGRVDCAEADCTLAIPRECTSDSGCVRDARYAPDQQWTCTWTHLAAPGVLNENGSVNSECVARCEHSWDCDPLVGFGLYATCACSDGREAATCDDGLPKTCQRPSRDGGNAWSTAYTPIVNAVQLSRVGLGGYVGRGGRRDGDRAFATVLSALDRGPDPCTLATQRPYNCVGDDGEPVTCERYATNACDVYTADALWTARTSGDADCAEALADCRWERFLDPDEPNFLRPDALLVVLFLADQEECSPPVDGAPSTDTASCVEGEPPQPVRPVAEVEVALRALKPDGRLVVGALVGDARVGGEVSCLIPDECLDVRDVPECRCYRNDLGDKAGCPAFLTGDAHDQLCVGAPIQGPPADEEMAYRLRCLDACLGHGRYAPGHSCATEVPEACGCYEHDATGVAVRANEPGCRAALADEPAYRLGCERACFAYALTKLPAQPNHHPYVCAGRWGAASLGARYLDLVARFGQNGVVGNICDGDVDADPSDPGTRLLQRVAERAATLLGLPPR